MRFNKKKLTFLSLLSFCLPVGAVCLPAQRQTAWPFTDLELAYECYKWVFQILNKNIRFNVTIMNKILENRLRYLTVADNYKRLNLSDELPACSFDQNLYVYAERHAFLLSWWISKLEESYLFIFNIRVPNRVQKLQTHMSNNMSSLVYDAEVVVGR